MTVLLVEDEALVRDMVQQFLQRAGFVVTPAEDAERALLVPTPEGGRFDVLVTDVMLPGKTGVQLAAILRRSQPDLKVLYVSGNLGEAVDRRELEQPGTFFLAKPFSRKALVDAVHALTGTPVASER